MRFEIRVPSLGELGLRRSDYVYHSCHQYCDDTRSGVTSIIDLTGDSDDAPDASPQKVVHRLPSKSKRTSRWANSNTRQHSPLLSDSDDLEHHLPPAAQSQLPSRSHVLEITTTRSGYIPSHVKPRGLHPPPSLLPSDRLSSETITSGNALDARPVPFSGSNTGLSVPPLLGVITKKFWSESDLIPLCATLESYMAQLKAGQPKEWRAECRRLSQQNCLSWLGSKFGDRLVGLDDAIRIRKLQDMTSQFLRLCDRDEFPHLKLARSVLRKKRA